MGLSGEVGQLGEVLDPAPWPRNWEMEEAQK